MQITTFVYFLPQRSTGGKISHYSFIWKWLFGNQHFSGFLVENSRLIVIFFQDLKNAVSLLFKPPSFVDEKSGNISVFALCNVSHFSLATFKIFSSCLAFAILMVVNVTIFLTCDSLRYWIWVWKVFGHYFFKLFFPPFLPSFLPLGIHFYRV